MDNKNEVKTTYIDNKFKKAPDKKYKCLNCKKRLGLLKFDCKCDNTFCIVCVLPEVHKCQFNYVEEQKIKLEKKLTKKINEKIQII